jgi:hypothetical protein
MTDIETLRQRIAVDVGCVFWQPLTKFCHPGEACACLAEAEVALTGDSVPDRSASDKTKLPTTCAETGVTRTVEKEDTA